MSNDLRSQALANWHKLFSMPASLISDEARYDKLLRAADNMERSGLISSDEWRKLVQQAGALLASTAECMGGAGQKQKARTGRALCRRDADPSARRLCPALRGESNGEAIGRYEKPGAGLNLFLALVSIQRHKGRDTTDYFRGAACVRRS